MSSSSRANKPPGILPSSLAARVAVPLPRPKSSSDEVPTASPFTSKPDWYGPIPDSAKQLNPTDRTMSDPFVTGMSVSAPMTPVRQLSAGATNFKPRTSMSSHITMLNLESEPDDTYSGPVIASSSACPMPTIDERSGPAARRNGKGKARATEGQYMTTIGTQSKSLSPTNKKVIFTTDSGPGHYIKIDMIVAAEFEKYFALLAEHRAWKQKVLAQRSEKLPQAKYMSVILCFDSVEDAALAEEDVNMLKPSWVVSNSSHADFSALKDSSGLGTGSPQRFDGQVNFQATFEGKLEGDIKTAEIESHVRQLAGDFGKVLNFARGIAIGPEVKFLFRVEYYCISDAKEALRALSTNDPHYWQDWIVVTQPIDKEIDRSPPQGNGSLPPQQYVIATPEKDGEKPKDAVVCSPTGRSAWIFDMRGKQIPVSPPLVVDKVPHPDEGCGFWPHGDGRISPHTPAAFGGGMYQHHASASLTRVSSWPGQYPSNENRYPVDGEPQSVNTGRILQGMDVRTTIMLRNLPNNWTFEKLKEILDFTSWGCYDFSYLRIDFEKNTNVGYAFVNFCDATDIVPFYEAYVGREWEPGSYGRKRAQVSYATVQGYDCLIEKFRNSAIMDECSGHRPKLWYTKQSAEGNDALVGTEKEFPPPNNLSKKQRSHDNASSIGLYAPRSGQRGSDRNRRSLYDRGTTSQINEDAMLNQGSPSNGNYVYHAGPSAIGQHPPPTFSPYMYGYPAFYNPGYFAGPVEGNGMRFAAPDPFQAAPYPGMPMYPAAPGYPVPYAPNMIMGTNNPASGLRTSSNGRLAGRPRNVTTAPNVFDGTAPRMDGPVMFNPVSYGAPVTPNNFQVPRLFDHEVGHAGPSNEPLSSINERDGGVAVGSASAAGEKLKTNAVPRHSA